jgi:hypothetical protein
MQIADSLVHRAQEWGPTADTNGEPGTLLASHTAAELPGSISASSVTQTPRPPLPTVRKGIAGARRGRREFDPRSEPEEIVSRTALIHGA